MRVPQREFCPGYGSCLRSAGTRLHGLRHRTSRRAARRATRAGLGWTPALAGHPVRGGLAVLGRLVVWAFKVGFAVEVMSVFVGLYRVVAAIRRGAASPVGSAWTPGGPSGIL